MHKHKWRIKAVNHYTREWLGYGSEPVTEALYVCDICEKPKTNELTGTWTVQQLSKG